MATRRKPNGNGKRGSGNTQRRGDAIALLKADHRQVQSLFEQARQADMPLEEISERLMERNAELEDAMGDRMPPQRAATRRRSLGSASAKSTIRSNLARSRARFQRG